MKMNEVIMTSLTSLTSQGKSRQIKANQGNQESSAEVRTLGHRFGAAPLPAPPLPMAVWWM